MRIGTIAAAAALAAATLAGAAMANPGVESRQALMKSIVGHTKAIGGYVKGQNAETPADVAKRAASIAADAARIGGAFGDQVHTDNAGDVKTTASSAIWMKWDEFEATAKSLEMSAIELAGAAAGGDKAAIGAAFGGMTKNCGACHKPFRVKK